MVKLRIRLLNIVVVLLLAQTLCACTGESLPSPTAVPVSSATVAPTVTVASKVAIPTTSATHSEAPSVEASADDAGTMIGLPAEVFQTSPITGTRQVLPPQAQIRSTDLPGVQELGAPDWVRPGTRITFYAAAATIVSRGEPKCTEDPNGDWEGQDGTKYKCTGMPGDPDGSASGDGLSQVDVLAVEGTDVVLATTLYGINHIDRQFTVAPTGGGKAPGDVIDGVWIHPARLAEIAEMNLQGVRILRGDYTVEGVTYKALSFVSMAPGSYLSYAYDTETGLLIAETGRTTPSNATTTLLDPPQTAATGNAQLYVRRLLGYRQRNMPGVNGTNPSWVARTKQFNYNGTWTFTNPMGRGGPDESMVYPMNLAVTFSKGGKNWVPFTAKSVINMGYPQESTGSGVTGSGGQYWIDPKALARLKKGQVIDEDPYTQEKLVVGSVNKGTTVKTLAVSSELPGNRSLFTYDLTTGALIDFQTSSSGSGITIMLRLQNLPR